MPRSIDKQPRRRRDVALVRAEILDAAERRMIDVGPDAVRLQDVAGDVGISHSNVLHHFGSKEALLGALVERSVESMRHEIVEAIVNADVAGDRLRNLFDALAAVLSDRGHARLIFWLTLGGHTPVVGSEWLGQVVEATLSLRRARGQRVTASMKRDTEHAVMLAALALTSAAVLGPAMSCNVGIPDDAASATRFRHWLADLLVQQMGLRQADDPPTESPQKGTRPPHQKGTRPTYPRT
ncbi:MAG: TetR/AcrR family transcriptional regulator [Polyangia bacterium]